MTTKKNAQCRGLSVIIFKWQISLRVAYKTNLILLSCCFVERDPKSKVAVSSAWISQLNQLRTTPYFSVHLGSFSNLKIQEFRSVWMHFVYGNTVQVNVCIRMLSLEWEVRYLSQLLPSSFWYKISHQLKQTGWPENPRDPLSLLPASTGTTAA